jgi:hypothetical protein
MLSRRKLFGFLAAAPVAGVVGPAVARGGIVSRGKPYLVGETPSEQSLPLNSVEVRHPAFARPVTITVSSDVYKIRLDDYPGFKMVGADE